MMIYEGILKNVKFKIKKKLHFLSDVVMHNNVKLKP